jgi:lactoylglutathione lyase
MEMKLSDVRLLVSDIARCRSFYKDTLRLEEQLVVVEGIYCEFKAGDCILSLYKDELMASVVKQPAVGAKAGDRAALIFRVDDVDKTYTELKSKGVVFVTEPHDQEVWSLRVAHFRDPEGNLIELDARLNQ